MQICITPSLHSETRLDRGSLGNEPRDVKELPGMIVNDVRFLRDRLSLSEELHARGLPRREDVRADQVRFQLKSLVSQPPDVDGP